MTAASRRRRPRRGRAQSGPLSLHIVTFRFAQEGYVQRTTTVLVRGRMSQSVAISLAGNEAQGQGREPWLTDIRTVAAPRATPALDAICQRHTAFQSLVELLTATAGYRPSIRLDLMGREGLLLAKAYDRRQTAWGDKRRAFVSGDMPQQSKHGSRHAG